MQNFVRDRTRGASPQNAQLGLNPSRQAIGANAKVSLQKGPLSQQPLSQSENPSRGFGNIQNSSAVLKQHPPIRQPVQGQIPGRDPYDTDSESLDTTVNHSIFEVEDSQKRDEQPRQPDHVDLAEEDSSGNEESSDEEEEEDFDFTQDVVHYIEHYGLQEYSREQQIDFLQQARPHIFRPVDGDSYPTTTDGDPAEWEGGKEPSSEHQNDGEAASPSPRWVTPNKQLTRQSAPQALQRAAIPAMLGTNQVMPTSSSLFNQSANIRNQQRSNMQATQQGGLSHHSNAAALPTGLYSSNNQDKREVGPGPAVNLNPGNSTHWQANMLALHAQRQTTGSVRIPLHYSKSYDASASAEVPSSAQPIAGPISQKQPVVEVVPTEDVSAAPDGDYDHEKLFAMPYDVLRNEDFDKDPRAGPPVLTDDMLQMPLVDRLQFVQKNFDAGRQADFFHSLRTTEWEDAGDWFLDQFQSIIQRTKEARQSKRKLAREFEHEIEKRQMHVSKKQHQVEDAMNKMKMQGESLMPKSPRASKSPRPKKD